MNTRAHHRLEFDGSSGEFGLCHTEVRNGDVWRMVAA